MPSRIGSAPRDRVDLVDFREHPTRARGDVLARGRQHHLPRRTLDERDAQFLLQLAHLRRQRGLAHVAGLRGAAEMPQVGEGHQIPQIAQIHRVSPLRGRLR